MPTVVTLPACLMDCYKVMYPNLDFSRVAFYSGLPTVLGLSAPDGFTMASGAAIPDIRVYIKGYKPCIEETFLTIAHELVHVIQIQGMLGGGRIPGSWTAYYTSHVLCGIDWSTCANELEKEAYDFANGVVKGNCGTAGKVRDYVDTVLRKPPCNCRAEPWPIANTIGAQTYAEALRADTDLVKTSSSVGRTWCSLLNWPADLIAGAFSIFGFSNTGGAIGAALGTVIGGVIGWIVGAAICGWPCAIVGAWVGGIVGGIVGGAIGWAINGIINWFGGLFSGDSAWIWFTAFDGKTWVIPDMPVSQNGHTLTSAGPAMAVLNTNLYLAYKGSDSDDLWYNVFDGTAWLPNDLEITQGGHSKTDAGPALAEYNGKLYLAYKGSGSNDLWYNVFDGTAWLPNDLEISQNGHSQTSRRPALAVYGGQLYLAYRGGGSADIWYNVFDGNSWLAQDISVTQGGIVQTAEGPALAAFEQYLFMTYRDNS
jgi:hypothetical protein